ncbi:MAG: dihydroorotate dehydrogenase-like protein [Bradymonadales bacterium]|nr:dihydroorotate dehydrogenase-like protein [Bradymonadales bacterium]
MDLTTTYLGMTLSNPLVPSASPLTKEIDHIRQMEDAGAAAVVLHSLFVEQLQQEELELHYHLTEGTESFAEALSYFPEPPEFKLGPEEYLEHIQKAKAAVQMPVIASLNGPMADNWPNYASEMEEAGADALELNIYAIPTDLDLSGREVEQSYLDIVTEVKQAIAIPVTVKLNPFFSNLANIAKQLDDAGADGLVLFNRFYQPDIDLQALEVVPSVLLSTPQAMRLPLRWIAILAGKVKADLAATSGIWSVEDVLKMLMVGAKVTHLCSALLKNGISHLASVKKELFEWLERHEYESVNQMQGSMSQARCPDPSAYERAQYMRALSSYAHRR